MAPPPELLRSIAQRHGLRIAVVFGSVARQQTHARSDVDVGVVLDRVLDYAELADLEHDVQQLFPDRKVDLVVLNHADPLLLKQVFDNYHVLYGDPRDIQRLRLLAFRRYQDHRKYFDLERAYVRDFIRRLDGSQ
jgi:predicted nucleotidyltransferase